MTFEGRMGRAAGLAVAFGGIVFALLVTGGTSRSANAVALQKDGEFPKPADEIKLLKSSECKLCHSELNASAKEAYQNTKGFEFIRLWENEIWSQHDPHSKAFENLATSLTKDAKSVNATADLMEKNLRRFPGRENYTIATDTACLACHASTIRPTKATPPAKWVVESFNTREGVGCEMCHGHGTAYQQKHRQPDDVEKPAPDEAIQIVPWRTWAPKAKEAWGLVNLRDPATAAAKCASCHVGNKDEGRFVTHEMYAVGHPPLPPLDLLAYSREQPRHWGLAKEMPYLTNLAKKDAKKAFDTFHYRDGESAAARSFAESTIGTLKSTTDLTHQLAADAKAKNDGLDYSAFDCYSCHHNLKYPSDRQARGYDGPPGRPAFRLAPFALARLVVDHASGMENGKELAPLAAQLDAVQKQLAMSFGNKTYGDPDLVMKAVADVNAWCESVQTKLAAVRYTEPETKKLLAKVVEAASREPIAEPRSVPASQRAVADPELAQLYSWAATTLSMDLAKDGTLPPGIAQLRDGLKGSVVTRLRPHAPFDYEVKATAKFTEPTQMPVDKRIRARMEEFNAFKGDTFREAFKKLK